MSDTRKEPTWLDRMVKIEEEHGPPFVPFVPSLVEQWRAVIESVEARCLAVDGPVTTTSVEMTDEEMRKLWLLTEQILREYEGERVEGTTWLDGDRFCPDCEDGQPSRIFIPTCPHDDGAELASYEQRAILMILPKTEGEE